jgi:DNA-directed RNA polymerase specialized sigma24 family protein
MQSILEMPVRVVGGEIIDPNVNVEAEVLDRLEAEELRRGVASLPSPEREAVVWSFGLNGVGELSLREIGDRLECSKPTAWRIRERGLEKLREAWR